MHPAARRLDCCQRPACAHCVLDLLLCALTRAMINSNEGLLTFGHPVLSPPCPPRRVCAVTASARNTASLRKVAPLLQVPARLLRQLRRPRPHLLLCQCHASQPTLLCSVRVNCVWLRQSCAWIQTDRCPSLSSWYVSLSARVTSTACASRRVGVCGPFSVSRLCVWSIDTCARTHVTTHHHTLLHNTHLHVDTTPPLLAFFLYRAQPLSRRALLATAALALA
jgi:hypothetical protein